MAPLRPRPPVLRPRSVVTRQRPWSLFSPAGLFSLWPSRRRNARLVTSTQLRKRRARAGAAFRASGPLGWCLSLFLHGAATVAELYFARWFFQSHVVRFYLDRIPAVDVDALWGHLRSIVHYVQRYDAERGGLWPQRQAARAVPVPGVPHVLAIIVHLRGRLSATTHDRVVVAPNSGTPCLRFRWALTRTYLEKRTVTKRRKLPGKVHKKHKHKHKKQKRKSRKQQTKATSALSASSEESEESVYEEWEEDETVERSETLQSGDATAPAPYAVVGTGSFAKHHQRRPETFGPFGGGDDDGGGGGADDSLSVHDITHWGGEEVVVREDLDPEVGLADIVLAPFTKQMTAGLERTEHVVHDGVGFEALGLLEVRLEPTGTTGSRVVAATLRRPGRTVGSTPAANRLNLLGPVQTLDSVLEKMQNGVDVRAAVPGDLSPRDRVPYLAETMSPSSALQDRGTSNRHWFLQYAWLVAAALAWLLRGWTGRALLLRAFGRDGWADHTAARVGLLLAGVATSPLVRSLRMAYAPRP